LLHYFTHYVARPIQIAVHSVAYSRALQSLVTISCLSALLWLNAAYLMNRLDATLAARYLRHGAPMADSRPLAARPFLAPVEMGSAAAAVPPAEDDPVQMEPTPSPATLAPIQRLVEVDEGDTLFDILAAAGIDRNDAQSAVEALSDVFQPRDLMPGQQISLTLEKPSLPSEGSVNLASLSLQPSVEREVTLTRGLDGGFDVEALEKPLTTLTVRASAAIDSSLYEAGQHGGVPTSIMSDVIRAFSYDVDFQRDIQPGDSYEVVYERLEDEAGNLARTGEVLYAALTLGGKAIELYRFETPDGPADFYTSKGENLRKALLRTPVDGAKLTSGFGMRKHPLLGYNKMHKGVDFGAPTGTPIYAAGDGVIVEIGRKGAYGNYIRIRHNNEYSTAYAHASRFIKGLKKGAHVQQGEVIAYVGATGRVTGAHLHYEILRNGVQVNPAKVKFPVGEKLQGKNLAAFEARKSTVDAIRGELSGGALLLSQAATPTETR